MHNINNNCETLRGEIKMKGSQGVTKFINLKKLINFNNFLDFCEHILAFSSTLSLTFSARSKKFSHFSFKKIVKHFRDKKIA